MIKEGCERQLNVLMDELCRQPHVVAVVIARRDGVVIASNLGGKANPSLVAAMAASIVGTSEMVVGELDQGKLVEVVVESVKGQLLGIGANEEAILVIVTKREANVGLVLLNIEKYSKEISRVISCKEQQQLLVETVDEGAR